MQSIHRSMPPAGPDRPTLALHHDRPALQPVAEAQASRTPERRDGAARRWAVPILVALALGLALAPLPGALPAARAADAPDPAADEYKLAVGLYNKSRWQLAADSFRTFLKANPKHRLAEKARFYLGLTLYNLEDFQQARDMLRGFIKDYPKSDQHQQALFWSGYCSYLIQDYAAAETDLAAFVAKAQEDPQLERALHTVGHVALRLKKGANAVGYLERGLKQFPDGPFAEDLKFDLARSYEATGKPADAIKLYRELAANRVGLRGAEACLQLGSRYFEDGNYPESTKAYALLIQQFPESSLVPLAHLNQGFALFRGGDFKTAVSAFEKAAADKKLALEAELWKGLSLKASGSLPEAIAQFEKAAQQFKDQPQAEQLVYQWADCEQRRGGYDKARLLFLDAVQRWPQGSLAAESLHGACQAAVNGNQLPEADVLLARFDKEYPGSKLRYRQEILKGRVLLARSEFPAAAQRFEAVLKESDIPSTQAQARFYLANAAQKAGQHDRVLEVTAPLIAQMEKDAGLKEFVTAYVMRAISALTVGKTTPKDKPQDKLAHLATALDAANKYLAAAPGGELADRALEVKTLATAHAGDKAAAQEHLLALRKQFPQSPDLPRTVFEVGEVAFANEDWEWAEPLFAELANGPAASPYHSRALSELGWTLYKRKKFPESAAAFARLAAEHPADPLVPESAFMRGTALQDANQLKEAQAVFSEAFQKHGDSQQAFLSGLQSARLLARLKQPAEADAAYEELWKRFPKPKDADLLLDEWAVTNYDAERFERADVIFRRLATEYPDSKLADNAQLILAESDLVSGRLADARTRFTALAASDKSDGTVQQRALYQLLRIELESKNWDGVRKVAAETLKRFPEGTYRWETEFQLAEAELQMQAYKESLERLARLQEVRDDPALTDALWYPRVWVLQAEIYFRQKQYADVAKTADSLRKLDPQSPLLYQVDEILGRSLKAQARFPEARAAFERAIKSPHGLQTETAAKSQFHIAETYLLEKNYKTAILEYLKVEIRYKYPEWQAPALFQAGVCHESLGEWKQAVKTYENMLKDYPTSEYAAKAKERLDVARKKAAL